MNRPYLLLSVILLFSSLQNYGQTDNPHSRFPEIRILISKSQYSTLLHGKGQKLFLKKPVLLINHTFFLFPPYSAPPADALLV